MKTVKKLLKGLLCLSLIIGLFSFEEPKGWFKAGSEPAKYDMGVDKGAGLEGKNAATIKSLEEKIEGFGTLMQTCLPDQYLGKRVRMSGMMKSKDVSDWAGFWFRIDEKGSSTSLGFDNMHDGKTDRAIKGTTSWTKYEIVLDVPAQATGLAYGALLSGTGQIWFAQLKFEIVDKSVPTTGKDADVLMPNSAPVNLDFED